MAARHALAEMETELFALRGTEKGVSVDGRLAVAGHRRLKADKQEVIAAGGAGVHPALFRPFTVPTATFRVLYCLFVIEHGRRRILHFNVTRHPSADWVVQQLRETFAEAAPYRYAILDRDSIFNADVMASLKATGLTPKRTSIQTPWQNGTAERWIGSCREILDHIIPVNEERGDLPTCA